MLKKIMTVLFILICLILQCSVLSALSLGGIVPNLLLILTSAYGLIRGEKDGLLLGHGHRLLFLCRRGGKRLAKAVSCGRLLWTGSRRRTPAPDRRSGYRA